jgi:small-conductance mechanosensitive channel
VPEETGYLYRLFRQIGLSPPDAETAQALVRRPLAILLVLVAALLLSRIGARLARRSVHGLVARSARKDMPERATKRAETLGGVAASMVRIAIWTMAALLALEALGANPGPLVAGASIVGVALGFGAQSLVKDFVSGFFVLAEDQYGVGDTITIGDVTGTVEEVNLRMTRIRSMDGTVWFLPNGEIRKVGNAAREWARAIVDVTVPTDADIAAAMAAIRDEVSKLPGEADWAEAVLEPPEVLGLESVSTDSFVIRVAAKTPPPDRARVARELRARLGARLRREGMVPAATAPPERTASAEPSAPADEPSDEPSVPPNEPPGLAEP